MTIDPLLLWFLFAGCTILGYIVGQLMARRACADRVDAWNEALGAYVLRQHQASKERVIHDVPTIETPVRWLNEDGFVVGPFSSEEEAKAWKAPVRWLDEEEK